VTPISPRSWLGLVSPDELAREDAHPTRCVNCATALAPAVS
jgi:hypothetical protein